VSGDRFGSTTDLITNLTTFPQVRLRTEIPDMFRIGPSPTRHLQSFLHEATHHWCFHSPVGAALSTLTLRARVDAARLVDERTTDRQPILERLTRTLTRQRVAQACLGPFVEGLALFAEFDATPRVRTRLRSEVMEKVAFFLACQCPGETSEDIAVSLGDSADGIPEVQQEVDRWLLLALGKSRMTAACVDRKANILVDPFDATSGYLPGYLFVKTIWDGLARRAPRLRNETDLALTYMRHHVFQDAALIRVLLSTSADDPSEIATTVAQAIDKRFDALVDIVPGMVEMFEQAIDSEDSTFDNPRLLWSIQVDPDDRRLAMSQLGALAERLGASPQDDHDPYDSALHLAWRAAMGGRPFISMGAMPLTFAVRDQHLICPDELELESAVNQASAQWLDEQELAAGTVELLFLRSESGLPTRLLSFTVDDRFRGLGAIPAGERADLKTWIGMLHQRTEVAASIIRTTGDVLEMLRPVLVKTTVLGEVEQSLPSRVSAMYLPWSLVHVRDAQRRAHLADVMRDKGLLRAVLESVEEVRALAALSLAVMRNPWIEFVETDLSSRGFDPTAVLGRFTALHEQQGFPWVEVVERQVLAVV
jgi:hypothetical protein